MDKRISSTLLTRSGVIALFRYAVWLSCLCLCGCHQLSAEKAAPVPAATPEFKPDILGAETQTSDLYAEAVPLGTITDTELAEISGLAASRTAKGLWWVHNDSGNAAKLYVFNAQGKRLGEFTVTGATNTDWEDMASYQVKGRPAMLYLADTGNTGGERAELTLYRLPEPNLSKTKSGATAAVEAFKFRYPTGKPDAEAIFADPATGRPYLVTKTTKPPCAVYRFPWPLRADATMTLEKVTGRGAEALSQLTLVTGAAAAPDGTRLVVRTYFTALELSRAKNKPFEALFAADPIRLKIPLERQGEAVSYSADGQSIVMTSEKVPALLFQLKRKPAARR
jgi:hypothetical protein